MKLPHIIALIFLCFRAFHSSFLFAFLIIHSLTYHDCHHCRHHTHHNYLQASWKSRVVLYWLVVSSFVLACICVCFVLYWSCVACVSGLSEDLKTLQRSVIVTVIFLCFLVIAMHYLFEYIMDQVSSNKK